MNEDRANTKQVIGQFAWLAGGSNYCIWAGCLAWSLLTVATAAAVPPAAEPALHGGQDHSSVCHWR